MKLGSTVFFLFLFTGIGLSQERDSSSNYQSKNRFWQFAIGVNVPMGNFKSSENINHGHASGGFNFQFGYFGALSNNDVGVAVGANAAFNYFPMMKQQKSIN